MLHVPLPELPAGGAQQMRAVIARARERERHHVLELVAEPVGAARLVVGRARPDAAHDALREEPAVEHDVEGIVGRVDLDGPEELIPEPLHFRQGPERRGRRAVRADQAQGALTILPFAQEEHDLARFPR